MKEKTCANLNQLSASPITHILLINLLNEKYKAKHVILGNFLLTNNIVNFLMIAAI